MAGVEVVAMSAVIDGMAFAFVASAAAFLVGAALAFAIDAVRRGPGPDRTDALILGGMCAFLSMFPMIILLGMASA